LRQENGFSGSVSADQQGCPSAGNIKGSGFQVEEAMIRREDGKDMLDEVGPDGFLECSPEYVERLSDGHKVSGFPDVVSEIVAGAESLPPDRVVCRVCVRRLRNEVPVKVDANDVIIVRLRLVSAEGREVRVSWEGLEVRGEAEAEDAEVDESAAAQSEAFP